jgi:hypothetical protein
LQPQNLAAELSSAVIEDEIPAFPEPEESMIAQDSGEEINQDIQNEENGDA